MGWRNYHTHSTFSDGKCEPELYIIEAIKRGMEAIGFSEHAPLPFELNWTMSKERVPEYIKKMAELKEQYRSEIEVLMGMEVDYIPEKISPNDAEIMSLGLDYRIGSIHFVGKLDFGNYWSIDSSDHDKFQRGLREIYDGDVKNVVRLYYSLMREMITEHSPDILGHIDLICMNTARYFSTDESWYQREMIMTLETVKSAGVILELNSGGIARGRHSDFYPGLQTLRKACGMGIPALLSADAHHPDNLTGMFDEALALLWEAGYRQVAKFQHGEWVAEAIER